MLCLCPLLLTRATRASTFVLCARAACCVRQEDKGPNQDSERVEILQEDRERA